MELKRFYINAASVRTRHFWLHFVSGFHHRLAVCYQIDTECFLFLIYTFLTVTAGFLSQSFLVISNRGCTKCRQTMKTSSVSSQSLRCFCDRAFPLPVLYRLVCQPHTFNTLKIVGHVPFSFSFRTLIMGLLTLRVLCARLIKALPVL